MSYFIKPIYAANDIIGTVNPPGAIPNAPEKTTAFISAIITLIVVVAGLFTIWQFISGGLAYITGGGDPKKISEANSKLTYAIVGLAIIAASFIIAGILGLVFFGKFNAILNPSLIDISDPGIGI